jgi:hypothetical protein
MGRGSGAEAQGEEGSLREGETDAIEAIGDASKRTRMTVRSGERVNFEFYSPFN